MQRVMVYVFRLLSVASIGLGSIAAQAALVDRATLADAGLVRAWVAQAPVDASSGGSVTAKAHEGALYALTSRGVLQAIDSASGAVLWTVRVGDPTRRSLGPAVQTTPDGVRLAIANGATIFLIDGANGNVLRSYRVPGAPGAAPALAGPQLFVPLVDGRIEGLPISDDLVVTWDYTCAGQIYDDPVAVGDRVLWTTTGGYLYGALGQGAALYRFRGAAPLVGPAAVTQTTAYIPTSTGLLYAVSVDDGRQLWRSSVGADVRRPALLSEGVVYVGSEEPALHAFDSETGKALWTVQGVNRFVTASEDRVYAESPSGRLAVIDVSDEEGRARWIAQLDATPITNRDDDRLLLVSASGLIQCLHEEGRAKPAPATPEETPADDEAETAPADEPAADESPFAAEEEPEAPAASDDPFATDPFAADEDEAPADEAPDDGGFDAFESDEDDPFADPF